MSDDEGDKPKLTIVKEGEEHEQPPSNLVRLPIITRLNLEPDQLLQEAMGRMDCVVIVGYTTDDVDDWHFASSLADAGTTAWLLQRALYKLNQTCDEIEENGLPLPPSA